MSGEELLAAAKEARKKAYCPYSGFAVGAALLADDGRVFSGCNIENASFGATCCAERVALFAAVAAGAKRFAALAIVGGKTGEEALSPCPPCGLCRQALSEFCKSDFPIYLSDGNTVKTIRLGEIFPMSFSSDQLEKRN